MKESKLKINGIRQIGVLSVVCFLSLCACGHDDGLGNILKMQETENAATGNAGGKQETGAEDGAGKQETESESGAGNQKADGQRTEESKEMNGNKDYEKLFEKIELAEGYKGTDHANPLMTQSFGADPYAMVYGDRVYFYMTEDAFEYDDAGEVKENSYSKIQSIRVISTADMVNFTDHGSIHAASGLGTAQWASNSWAPAAAWKEIDGKPKFFLYFADAGGGIGVLTADSPAGPFTDPLGKGLITRSTPNCGDVTWLFDPAVLVDDDGRAYLYFGGGIPEGRIADPGTARVVELGEDMISIVGEPVRIDVPYLFEDSGIHKAGDKYYYTYCSNWQVDEEGTARYGFRSAEIVSMESDSPMGPFTVKETILENPGRTFGLYGNNHHCVFSFRDNWYITYHTRVLEQAMGVEKGYRCTHVDSFTMQEDGTIGVIKQTLKGREQLSYVNPYEENRAAAMAVMAGIECVPADESSEKYGCGNMALGGIHTGDYVKVQGVDFGAASPDAWKAAVRKQQGQEGVIQLRADGTDGKILGYLSLEDAGEEFTECTAALEQEITGVHDLFLIFYGEGYEIDTWQFVRE